MEKFLEQMARIMQRWPDYAEWSVSQLVDYTHFPADDVVAWMSFGTNRPLATDSRLSYEEADAAVKALAIAHTNGMHIKFSPQGTVTENLRSSYDQIIARNRAHLQNRDWRRAYRSLVNYLNQHKGDLPLDLFTEALAECLRLAPKANATAQEIFGWLEVGIAQLTEDQSKEGTSEALDFVDAYAESLAASNPDLVQELLNRFRPLCDKHGLLAEWQQISADLLAE